MNKLCVNGDGRPICPPSKVICRECMDKIGKTLLEMMKRAEAEDAREKGDGLS